MKHSDRASAPVRPSSVSSFSFTAAIAAAVLSACAGDLASDDVDSTEQEVLIDGAVTSGSVTVTLHPGASAAIGSATTVSFGTPFPPGVLTSAAKLSAVDPATGKALPIHAVAILPWRVWPGRTGTTESVRSAMVSVHLTFASRSPKTITLRYGSAPTATLAAPADPRLSWVAVTDGEYPSGTVREPRVYATFPTSWLSRTLLRTRALRVGGSADWSWYDASVVGSARTAVNDVPSSVTERINYTTDAEPWLFDRTGTLFTVYARTGDVKWLRHAHRSAQFYRKHITAAGYFDLKDGDLKYSYGRSLLTDFIFTGDPTLLTGIQQIAAAGATWKPAYTTTTNFWTERHQTYALLAALAAWEASGAAAHADRVKAIIAASFGMTRDPLGTWKPEGCMLHGMTDHEGAGGDVPICSPWMSALFADAIWSYFIQSNDAAALEFLAGLGHFVADQGLYAGGDGIDFTVPWYLASSVKQFSDEGPWGDVEHTCDVAGLVARGAWAERQLGRDPTELRAVASDLLEGCKWDLAYWHRPGGPAAGKAEWRVSPGRKFNWWFGTTSDLGWLMANSL